MTCPECGVEMNHHAEKLVYATTAEEGEQCDPDLGGIIEETHACPECGSAKSNRDV